MKSFEKLWLDSNITTKRWNNVKLWEPTGD